MSSESPAPLSVQFRHEFTAMQAVHTALKPLDDHAKMRVLNYVMSMFAIGPHAETAKPEAKPK
ncbi:hypothetical protein [Paraburkholderia sp. MM6662-R1]|uniref:hypothetical protein n=1 Tax=Paraburkholderia sp. MM6662-R1 TaxID=2991066 RepID=UPI003D191A44